MQKSLVRKGLVLGIIVLFVGASGGPSIGGDVRTGSEELKERSTQMEDYNDDETVIDATENFDLSTMTFYPKDETFIAPDEQNITNGHLDSTMARNEYEYRDMVYGNSNERTKKFPNARLTTSNISKMMRNDTTPPEWRNQGQSNSSVEQGKSILLYAQGKDETALDYAWLATNETGVWNNFTGLIGWNFFKEIGIDNPTKDYQLPILIFREDGYDDIGNGIIDCEGHCNMNFSDIRFINKNHTAFLPYWIEENDINTNGDHYARIWVKLSEDDTILMVYGNPNAIPISNGSNTFIFFDDFLGTDYNHTIWEGIGSPLPTVADSWCTVPTGGTDNGLRIKTSQGIESKYSILSKAASYSPTITYITAKLSSKGGPQKASLETG